jgi:magnesium-transporting ATPase (P-type)
LERLSRYGPNRLARSSESGAALLLVRQFSSPISLPVRDVGPGDVVVLSAGAAIPADCHLLEEIANGWRRSRTSAA